MKRLVFLALILPMSVFAQAHKCTDAAGRVTYSEAACPSTSKATQVTIRETGAAPGDASKERTASMRTETIQLMLSNGKISEARAYAKTAEERAMVSSFDAADREQRKAMLAEQEAAERRRQRELDKGQRARSVLR